MNQLTDDKQSSKLNQYPYSKTVLVSSADKANYTRMKERNLSWVFANITSDVWKSQIEKIRNTVDTEEKRALKQNSLGYFIIGTFKNNKRSKEAFISTEFMILDFDHLGGRLNELKEKFKSQNNVYAAFISPSGDGLKVIYRFEKPVTDSSLFSSLYKYYSAEIGGMLGVKADATSDASRACFFSYDPKLYINESSATLSVNVKFNNVEANTKEDNKEDKEDSNNGSREELLQAFNGSAEGSRHTSLTKVIGTLLNRGIDEEFANPIIEGWNLLNTPPLPSKELHATLGYMYKQYKKKDILVDFYSQGKEVYELGFTGDEFFTEKIGYSKFKIIVMDRINGNGKKNLSDVDLEKAVSKEYGNLVLSKHIKHLARVDYLGDANKEINSYEVLLNDGIIKVQYAMLKAKDKDNQFIEEYLSTTFGGYKDFIKQYLAVYCFTNYRKLPTLIFYGERGSGKTTFAEVMMEIYRPLSTQWMGNEQNFTPEVEKKLLLVEENNSDKASQYKTLKKYSGQKSALVNKKFKEPYEVLNNVNIILISNEPIPLYVKKEELPTNEANNQFFVFEFKKLDDQIDASFQNKLIDRLGHYIRTELKDVFDKLSMDSYRYSIKVPITPEEKNLFNSNTTEIDYDTDEVIHELSSKMAKVGGFWWREFIERRFLPSGFIKEFTESRSTHKNSIIKQLRKRRMITSDEPQKKQIGNKRGYCYVMTEDFYKMVNSEFTEVDGDEEKCP